MTQMLAFKVELQTSGPVNQDYVRRSLEFAITHYREAEGLSHADDEGYVEEFQVTRLGDTALDGGEPALRAQLQTVLTEVEEGYDLHHYAARDALQTLAANWLADDKVHPGDVDEVVRILREVGRRLHNRPSLALDALRQARAATERVQVLNAMTIEAMHGALRDALEKATREANSQMDTDQIAVGKLIMREAPAAFDLNLINTLEQGAASIGELDQLIALAEVGPLTLRDLENV